MPLQANNCRHVHSSLIYIKEFSFFFCSSLRIQSTLNSTCNCIDSPKSEVCAEEEQRAASRSVRSYLHHLHIGQLKQGVWMIAYKINPPAADLWPHSNSIFGAAVHKSQPELLTVNWACQDAQLIQRLCQAIVILCIETRGPDSPYTTVNVGICQRGFVALAAPNILLE